MMDGITMDVASLEACHRFIDAIMGRFIRIVDTYMTHIVFEINGCMISPVVVQLPMYRFDDLKNLKIQLTILTGMQVLSLLSLIS